MGKLERRAVRVILLTTSYITPRFICRMNAIPLSVLPGPSWLMKRGWTIINLDKREYVLLPVPPKRRAEFMPLDRPQLGDDPFGPDPTPDPGAMSLFAVKLDEVMWPLIEPDMLPMNEVLSKLPSQKLRLENGVCDVHTLVTLPLDVQALIFAAIETLRDAVALSLTSSHLALAGWSRIKQLSKEKWARWSGDRILALPGHDRMAFWGGPTPECILAHSDIAAAVDDAGSLVRYLETFRPAKHQQCPPSLREIARISPQYDWRRFGGVSLCRYPLDAPWVICNLSQRVYVRTRRKNTAPNATPAQDGQGSAWYDRSNLTETLWETVPEKISSWERGTGRWATNRIAVCTLDKASATHDDWSEWTDITASQEGLS